MGDLVIRAALILGGLLCVGCEVWGTYEFLIDKYQRVNYLVAGGVVLTSLAAILPLGAEYAHRHSMHGLKWLAWLSVPIALSFVFTVSVQRTGTVADADETARKQGAQSITIANTEAAEATAQLVTDKAAVASNCKVWGPICDKAKDAQAKTEKKLSDARAVLKKDGVAVDDSMAKRLVTYLPFLTKEQVLLYQPLLLPLGLAVVGSIMIAIGARGKKPTLAQQPAAQPSSAALRSGPGQVIDAEPVQGDPSKFLTSALEPGEAVSADEVCLAYEAWCKTRGCAPIPRSKFKSAFIALCEQSGFKRSRGKIYGMQLVQAKPVPRLGKMLTVRRASQS